MLCCRIPWRIQKIESNSPDLDSYGKPLPPPPVGTHWEKALDNSWSLVKTFESHEVPKTKVFSGPSVIEHTVMSSDTLQGICLRYRVSALDLRRYNLFSGNNIQCKKTLRIPLEPGIPVEIQDFDSREIKSQIFRNETQETIIETNIYLEENNWDLKKALEAWKQDDNWAQSQARVVVPAAVIATTQDLKHAIDLDRLSSANEDYDDYALNIGEDAETGGGTVAMVSDPSLQPLLF